MKYITTLALLLATTSLAVAADNESFILQAGGIKKPAATSGKSHDPFTNGYDNNASVAQTSNNKGKNLSGVIEFGNFNSAKVKQNGGNNAQGTFQIGNDNSADTTQTNDNKRLNRSATVQLGNGNKSDATQSGGGNDQGTLQISDPKYRSGNYAKTNQTTGGSDSDRNNSGILQVGAENS